MLFTTHSTDDIGAILSANCQRHLKLNKQTKIKLNSQLQSLNLQLAANER